MLKCIEWLNLPGNRCTWIHCTDTNEHVFHSQKTGEHSIKGDMERARVHWEGFIANQTSDDDIESFRECFNPRRYSGR